MKETELAKNVVNWLRDYKWEVYQEVSINEYVADIVATQGNLSWIIECKTTMSLEVIRQADNWFGKAHYVSVAVPYPYCLGKSQAFSQEVLKRFGVGQLYVDYRYSSDEIKESIKPRLNRHVYPKPSTYLKEEHKTYAEAGNSEGKRYTPFQDTCGQILKEVVKAQGLTIKEVINRIKHHYATPSTAIACIARWADKGLIKGVVLKRIEGRLRLYVS